MGNQIIECPKCEWIPDGGKYWRCECGHLWNTFETKGICPECNKQWKDTYCPGCSQSSGHELWYITSEQKLKKEKGANPILLRRKRIIEKRLVQHGIKYKRISYLPYLEFNEQDFQNTYDVGCRILVLWSIWYLADNLDKKENVKKWLTENNLWEKVSPNEKLLFSKKQTKNVLAQLSWRIEAVIVLCWSLNLLENLPPLNSEISEAEYQKLEERLPVGENTSEFLQSLKYRNTEEIFIENIVNEMATCYFRDLIFNRKENESDIDQGISFERHQALNWLRQFGGNSEWDDTDTST